MYRTWKGVAQWSPFEVVFDDYGVEFGSEGSSVAGGRCGDGIDGFHGGDGGAFDLRSVMSFFSLGRGRRYNEAVSLDETMEFHITLQWQLLTDHEQPFSISIQIQ